MAARRIGELLMERGILSGAQIDMILRRQHETGEPFGKIAAELFGVQEAELWRAWAVQVVDCCAKVDLALYKPSPSALAVFSSREAWAYRILPLKLTETELVCATSSTRLPNAMAFAQIRSEVPVTFLVADVLQLEQYILSNYSVSPVTTA